MTRLPHGRTRYGKSQEHYVVNEKGQKTAVIIRIEEHGELLEDIHELTVIAKRRDEPTISLTELKKN